MASTTKPPKGFPALRRALTEKTKWSRQAVSQRVRQQKKRMPMKTGVAQAIVAHGQNIRLDRYLTGTDLQEVQDMMAKVGNGAPAAATTSGNGKGRSAARAKAPVARPIIFKALNITTTDPFLPKAKIDEANEMGEVYPVLYLLENSIRHVIKSVMEAKFGATWWNTELTNARCRDVKNKVAQRRQREQEQSWHQRRAQHDIGYTDLADLLVIAQSKRDIFFPVVIGDEGWFQSLVNQTAPSRHVLAHMNPLSANSVAALGVRLQEWHLHLQNREAEVRAAMTPTP